MSDANELTTVKRFNNSIYVTVSDYAKLHGWTSAEIFSYVTELERRATKEQWSDIAAVVATDLDLHNAKILESRKINKEFLEEAHDFIYEKPGINKAVIGHGIVLGHIGIGKDSLGYFVCQEKAVLDSKQIWRVARTAFSQGKSLVKLKEETIFLFKRYRNATDFFDKKVSHAIGGVGWWVV